MEYPSLRFSGNNTNIDYIDGHVYIVGPIGAQLGLFIHGTRRN